ncbi:ABC transporter permease [Berryella wangjianweii]|uniref:ABC transporter permease n=1 Tax=Berryella wangjianweii TaxID=2734634 RepID=A0A6M8J1W4_9ACTN|nr:ABC transporter permease [Berryella wangjianweii]QKF07537.1 ABC transporter permease [Berryella wangjianweii]
MKRYVLRRLAYLLPILLGITVLSFSLLQLAGGDAVTMLAESQGTAVSEELLDARRAELGLNDPLPVQYIRWLGGILTGDLGVSYVSGKPVLDTLMSKLPATMLLAGLSVLATVAISVPLGVYAAVRANRFSDYAIRVTGFVGNALPNFFVALLLVLVFSVQLGWFPVISSRIGASGLDSLTPAGMVLPTATLALSMASKYTRQIRAAVLDELSKPYVQGARARGVGERAVLVGGVLRNCMVMIVTMLALSIGDLLGGAAIVETIFQWDGAGKLAVDAIALRDYPIIQAYVVWMAIIYVAVNLVADLLYRALDPRVRLEAGERL